jgi:hypothetical protein
MSTKIKRSLVKTFLNVGTLLSPTWALIGDGVKTGKIAYNPKDTAETYVSDDNASVSVDSYAPKMALSQIAKFGDSAFNFIDTLRIAHAIMEAAETQVVNVWLYVTPTLSYYLAEQQKVAIQIDDFGGDGGVPAEINYTINYVGTPVLGAFNPVTLTFVASPVLAGLASLVIGSVTLNPVFLSSWLFYDCTVTAGSSIITAVAAFAGSVITITNNGSAVTNGGPSTSWNVGVNLVVITVVNGTETVVYTIHVTK